MPTARRSPAARFSISAATYPSTFDSRTTRRALSGETTFQVAPELAISGGARWEREQGFDDPDGDPTATRNNGGAFVEARASVMNRAYLSGGVGVEHNEVFGNEVGAAVLGRGLSAPTVGRRVGDTKVSFNVGKGIKAPSVFQEQNALFELVQGTPAAAERVADRSGEKPRLGRRARAGIRRRRSTARVSATSTTSSRT